MEKIISVKIKSLILLFISGLVISGLTAFPLETELGWLVHYTGPRLDPSNPLKVWLDTVYKGICKTNLRYPFIAYGTDWLAFAHLIIAIAFIGPLKDPVKNIWIVEFGIISCILIFPLALISGEIRAIPLYWRLIDCCFGAIGLLVLLPCHRLIKRLSAISN